MKTVLYKDIWKNEIKANIYGFLFFANENSIDLKISFKNLFKNLVVNLFTTQSPLKTDEQTSLNIVVRYFDEYHIPFEILLV